MEEPENKEEAEKDFFATNQSNADDDQIIIDNHKEEEEEEEEGNLIWAIIENAIGKDGLVKIGEQILSYQKDKNATQLKRDELRLASGEKNSHYFKTQYFQDMGMVAMVLISILLLSYLELLETSTTGTLMGSIIGYALGQFRERYRPKS